MSTIESHHDEPYVPQTREQRKRGLYWKNRTHSPHFRSHEEEFDAQKLGMWLFLATEVLLFAGIFCAYAVFRMMHPEAWTAGSHHLDWKIGAANTVVLLLSSFTAAMAVRSAQKDQQGWLKINLVITIICAIAFVFIKVQFEYLPKLGAGKAPGTFFSYPYWTDPYEPLWWGVYYLGTGLHALHVVIGASLLAWVLYRSVKYKAYGPTEYTMVENSALYWHLVDLVWIFLFPLLYLIH